jgi:Carbon-nitrogen hydrolase
MNHRRILAALAVLLPLCSSAAMVAGETGPRTLMVVVITSQSAFGDVEANLNHFEQLIAEAATRGARLVCFPELALVSYSRMALD